MAAPTPVSDLQVQPSQSRPVVDSVRAARQRSVFVRRVARDYSQKLRLTIQAAFLALNLGIGVQFYFWVLWAESGARTSAVSRPAGVEGWLPIEGLMQLKYVLATRTLPPLHAAGFFLFLAFLVISVLFRKAFCSWLCPVGTFSEYLWKLGRYTFGRNFQLPRWLDIPLRSLKYAILGFFVYAVGMMSASSIAAFIASPYGLVVDVRMLNFFRYLEGTAAFVILGLIVASIFIQNFWCRYLCPYGAWLGLAALASPLRMQRVSSACIDCAKCAKVCPSALPVDKLIQMRSAECTGCLECVAACPAQGALQPVATLPLKRYVVPAWVMAAGIAIVFLGLVGYAKATGHWETRLPDSIYLRLVPLANQQQHPAAP